LKQKYETIVIFDGSLPDDTIQKENTVFEEFLKTNTEFEKTDIWGKRNLAYQIRKKRAGVYYLYNYEDQSEKNIAGKIEKYFKLNDSVLRHLTVIRETPKPVDPKKAGAPKIAEESVEEGSTSL
jgi:small subunit ribosomal protein S6